MATTLCDVGPRDGLQNEARHVATADKIRFIEALKRIALLSVDKSNAVKIGLTANQLRISSQNPDLGEAKDDLEIQYDGGEIAIGFNARYLTDVLGVLDGDQVAFELGDDHSPGVLHAPGDRSYTAVVMPMRV